ncbi:4Fe-4S dicluster domain-containing protein [Pirellulaceae bacterium SH449]
MTTIPPSHTDTFVSKQYWPHETLGKFIDQLRHDGYTVIGPKVDQGAIVYEEIERLDDLPMGVTDQQAPGSYRLNQTNEQRYFEYAVGPHSWKKFLFPPRVPLMETKQTPDGWVMQDIPQQPTKFAFLGVRACELAAIAIQDRIFLSQSYTDPTYEARRRDNLIVALNCTSAADTCFCTSMGTGPRCTNGFDIALTEIDGGFLVEVGSDLGSQILNGLPSENATDEQIREAEVARQKPLHQITRRIDTENLKEKLLERIESPRWDDIASRCLGCTNCTLVCPTCFCHSVEEVTDLTQDRIVRERQWDSCFNLAFSHAGGGSVRNDIRSRYRQWMTHKLAYWIDQFGTSGCVGCGRCITWCPVGIDLTAEVAQLIEGEVTA